LGSIDLVPFAARAADGLGLSLEKFYLFRLGDVFLQAIDRNATDVVANLRPLFKRLDPDDLTRGNLVMAVVADLLTEQIVEILTAMALDFPRYVVGFVPPPLHAFVNMSVGGALPAVPGIAIFNVSARVYLPVPPALSAIGDRSPSEVIAGVKAFLAALPEFVSVSEPPPIGDDGDCAKIVGTTYESFVQGGDADAVVLYVALDDQRTGRWLSAFRGAAARARGSSARFGIINATANAANFPPLRSLPHIEIFPAGRGAEHQTFFGRVDEDAILRFIRRCGATKNLTFEVAPEEQRDRAFEIMEIWKAKSTMEGGEVRKANDRLGEIHAAMKAADEL
jgi:hypothetical protein